MGYVNRPPDPPEVNLWLGLGLGSGLGLVRPLEPPVRLVVFLLSLWPAKRLLFVYPCPRKQFIQAAECYTPVKGAV